MEDADESSSESSIQVAGIVDFANSPHTINKKAYKLTLTKDSDGSNEYRSRIGLNLYQLPLGLYTVIVKFFPPEMSNISVTASGQTIYIANQTTKIFSNYPKTLIKFHQNSKQAPDYIFIDLHGKTTKSDTTSYLIVYGTKGYYSSIDPTVYDCWYIINNGNLELQTSIDMKNHKVTNLANPTSNNDAVNKRYLDIFETKIYNLLPPKRVYKEVFGTDFYDLVMDTTRFSLVKSVSGVAIDKVEPNFYPFTDRFLADYDPKYGIKIGVKSHILTATFNDRTSCTIFISFLHDSTKTCEIVTMSNLHTDEYPKFIINENKIIIHGRLSGKSETTFTSGFKNKQLFLWICYNSTLNLYKMALCNYSSRVTKTVPKDIARHQGVRFDYDVYVSKIGFTKKKN